MEPSELSKPEPTAKQESGSLRVITRSLSLSDLMEVESEPSEQKRSKSISLSLQPQKLMNKVTAMVFSAETHVDPWLIPTSMLSLQRRWSQLPTTCSHTQSPVFRFLSITLTTSSRLPQSVIHPRLLLPQPRFQTVSPLSVFPEILPEQSRHQVS